MDRVAVFCKEKELVPFTECNRIYIYTKKEDGWYVEKSKQIVGIYGDSIVQIRAQMKEIMDEIGDVKAVACKEILGIPFSELNKAGYCIFSVDDFTDETLDGILSDIVASDERARIKQEIIQNASPVEMDTPGIYYLDLEMLQKECPDVSSKKALKPFLETTPFLELRIRCAHIPPWLQQSTAYNIETKAVDAAIIISLTKKQC